MRRRNAGMIMLVLLAVAASMATGASEYLDATAWSQKPGSDQLIELAGVIEKLQGDDSRYLARAGHLMLKAGQKDKAVDLFNRSLASDEKDDEAWIIIGNAYSEVEEWAEADTWYQKAVDKDPKDADHRVEWGVSLMIRGDKDRAAGMFKLALDESPKAARLYYKMGRAID